MTTTDSGGWEIPVRLADGRMYPVRIGPRVRKDLPRLLERLVGAHRYALIGDDRVMDLHGEEILGLLREAGMMVEPIAFPPGEGSKSRDAWASLTDRLVEAGLGRDGCVIALGGGVSGDLAGFVAATYMRGVPLVQVPTSLVAMMDSAVGGKTGVDVPGGKNLVGAFHPPRLVLADTDLARTLPRAERAQGLAEAAKHGAILDAAYLRDIRSGAPSLLDGDPTLTAETVARSVELKARVVSSDEREGGLRQILNFGHTLGHALEARSGYTLPHGSAVAIGMVLEAELGEDLGVTAGGTARELAATLDVLELPTAVGALEPMTDRAAGTVADELVAWTYRDKKAREGEVRYVLLRELGEVDPGENWGHIVPREVVRKVLSRSPGHVPGHDPNLTV